MLADPLVLGANSLPAISRGASESIYQLADGSLKATIGHQYRAERHRFLMRLDRSKIAADPLMSGRNIPVIGSTYVVVQKPVVGFTTAEAVADATMLLTQLLATSSALLTKVVGGET